MKRIALLVLFGLLILTDISSQTGEAREVRILFRGLVIDANTLTPLSNTQVMINRSFISISDNEGNFVFYVNRKDTVTFKRLGYKAATFFVSDTLRGQEFVSGIYLNSDTLEIAEVIIIPRYSNLKSDLMNGRSKTSSTFDNAKYNVAVSAYQGRTTQGQMGDPANNYAYLKNKQKVDAYERGGIPSDRILGLSPLLLIPAAYMLVKGVPDKPGSMKSTLTNQELDEINKKYLESLKRKKY